MEDPGREEAAIDVEQDDELDLSLGLRPATSRRILYLPNPAAAVRDGSSDLSLTMPIWGKEGARPEQEPDGLVFPEIRTKREAQALKRQEARKKRDRKRKLKVDPSNLTASERLLYFENRRALGRESEGDCSGRRRKGRNCNGSGVDAATIEFDSNELNVLPYLMMPGLAVSDSNGVQPVAGAGGTGSGEFRTYQVAEKKSGYDGGGFGNQLKRSVSSCSRGSSSGGSDYQSTSGQGGSSSDGGSTSSHSHPPDLTVKSCTTTSNSSNSKADCNSSSYQIDSIQTNQSLYLDQNSDVRTQASTTMKPMPTQRIQSPCPVTNKPPKPKAHQSNETVLLPQMPCVTATGNGPTGKRITGFLYKYTKLEVSIVCVCHGTSFSPAGFVEHAGGVGIANPLRHITISPPPPAFS